MLKLSKLFYSSTDEESFLKRIVPDAHQRATLTEAKNAIRDRLMVGIRAATVGALGMNKAVSPRFRTQGSWNYANCVQPAWRPPQEIDWDYGVYLPVSVLEDNGPPPKMAKAYFDLVEGLLRDLCKQKGWSLVSGKDTCIRVQIASWAHIDLPLYAAPEDQFKTIVDKVVLAGALNKSFRFADSAEFAEMLEQEWADLDSIHLATRSGEWKPSDPEAVARWYRDKEAEHGEQLNRVCHYLKAWRDYRWKEGGPSSVSIMIAVAQRFEAWRGRDDKALECAARTLAKAIKGEIREQGIEGGQDDFNRLAQQQRDEASRAAMLLAEHLQQARLQHANNVHQALAMVMGQFGQRIPDRPDLIEPDAADDVRSVPARSVPPPIVRTTKAG